MYSPERVGKNGEMRFGKKRGNRRMMAVLTRRDLMQIAIHLVTVRSILGRPA
jgi:hypothetical protein